MRANPNPNRALFTVTWMTARTAERHARWTHSVPPHLALCWTPATTILVRYEGGRPLVSFTSRRRFREWLRAHAFRVVLTDRRARARHHTARTGYITRK